MRFIFLISALFFTVTLFGQFDKVALCEDSIEYFEFQFSGTTVLDWENYLESIHITDDVNQIHWEWEELGPKGTPDEGAPSKALKSFYLNRGNGTGRINKVLINRANENLVFACSPTGGLFFSENKGKLWENGGTDVLPISGVSSVTVNPNNHNNWIISTGDGDDRFIFSDGVYRTFNRGDSWEKINGIEGYELPITETTFGFHISEIVAHPCDYNKQFLACNKGLYKSDNLLDSKNKIKWRKVSEEMFYDIEIHPSDESIILAGGESLSLSRNCGKDWKSIKRPVLPDEEKYGLVRMSIEISAQRPELAYVVVTRKKGLGQGGIGEAYLFEFNLVSESWEKVRSLKKGAGNVIPTRGRAFEISPVNDSIVIIGNVKPAYRSFNCGLDFEKISSNQMHDDIHDFEFFSDGQTILAGHDGGVSISYDLGLNWTPWDDGIGAANVHGMAVGQTLEPIVLYGAYDCGTTLLVDSVWKHVGFGDGFESVIQSKDSSKMVLSMQNGNLYSSENELGVFNEKVNMRGMKASWHTWVQGNQEYENILYESGSSIIRSLNFGKDWEVIFNPQIQSENQGRAWRFYQTDGYPDELYVVVLGDERSDDLIYFSNNVNDSSHLVTWEKISALPEELFVSSILRDNACETCHFMSFNTTNKDSKVYYFNGHSYSDISEGIGHSSIRSGVRDRNTGRIYLGTKAGVFTKLPEEENWSVLTGLPHTKIRSMVINYKTLEIFVGTFGRGIWKAELLK